MKTDLFLNPSALNYLSCDRLYQTVCLWGYAGFDSTAANFGTDFHRFARHFEHPVTPKSLMEQLTSPAIYHFPNNKPLISLCTFYEALRPLNDASVLIDCESTPALEYQYSIPYLETDSYRIILCGTIDRIDKTHDFVRVVDRKTTNKVTANEVLDGYLNQIQVPFYMYIFEEFLRPTLFPHIPKSLSTIGHYQAILINSPGKFPLSKPIVYNEGLRDELDTMIRHAAAKMVSLAESGAILASPTGMAAKIADVTICKYCHLQPVCQTHNAETVMNHLRSLTPSPYDPRTWQD